MKLNLYKLFTPLVLGVVALSSASCDKKELDDIAPKNVATAEIASLATASNVLFEETFEGSAIFPRLSGVRQQTGTDYGLTVATSKMHNGSKSARFELRDTDPMVSNGTRSEIIFPEQINLDRWYSFAVYFPADYWQTDSKQDVITQWHQGGGVNPSASLRIDTDKLFFDVRKEPSTRTRMPLGTVVKDSWQTFVVHIKHSNGPDGLVEIWQNGEKVVNYVGGNSYNLSSYASPRWKLGIYKSDWNEQKTTDTKKRVLYFDDIRLGNEKSALTDMLPKSAPVVPVVVVKPKPVPVFINAGGEQLTDNQQHTWTADAHFSGGGMTYKSGNVADASNEDLYRSYRFGSAKSSFSYSIPVKESGSYTVKLHFAELNYKAANQRLFNVDMEGQRVLTNHDIYSDAGFGKANIKTFTNIPVTDGVLNIDLSSVKNNAIISAIEFVQQQ